MAQSSSWWIVDRYRDWRLIRRAKRMLRNDQHLSRALERAGMR